MIFLLIGWALRAWDWNAFPYHPDEALYGYWARLIASGRDPWLFSVYVDKPPLFIYALAGAFKLLGVSEASARVLNVFASFALLPVLWALFRRWFDDTVALAAVVVLALAPFEFLFAPTALTDPFLALWVFASLLGVASGNFFAGGLAGGLAYASKQQSVLFIPIALFAMLKQASRPKDWLEFVAGLGIPFALVTWWDSLRWAFRPSFWDRSIVTYGGIYLEPVARWGRKAIELGRLLGDAFSIWPAAVVAVALLLFLLGKTTSRWRGWDFALASFSVAYLLLHIVVSFRIWDRYLLPLYPLLVLSALRGLQMLGRDRRGKQVRRLLFLLLVVSIAAGIPWAIEGKLPVGGEHRLHQGIASAATFFEEEAPPGSVLYHHWLGWYWDYYLFDDRVDLRYYFTPEYLAENSEKVLPQPAFIVIPAWETKERAPIEAALKYRGLKLRLLKRFYRRDGSLSFTLYEIVRRESAS